MKTNIYALKDESGIRYIGKTVQRLENRLAQHIAKSLRRNKTAKERWISSLIDSGSQLRIESLEIVPSQEAGEAERNWMAKGIENGCDLVNEAPGGAGGSFRKEIDWSKYEHLLGKMPDEALADQVGVTRKAVAYQREKRDIIPCGNREELRSSPPNMGGWNAIDLPENIIALLGTMSDESLSTVAGTSKKRIMVERHRRGIRSWGEQNKHPTRYRQGHYPARWLTSE